MAVSMALPSSVRARVAELEALVDQREVGDDRAQGGERDGGPVGVARRPQVVAIDAAGAVGAQPVDRGAARRLDRGEPDAPRRQQPRAWRRGSARTAGRRAGRGPAGSTRAPPPRARSAGRGRRRRPRSPPTPRARARSAYAACGWSRRASRSTPLARAATPVTPRAIASCRGRTPVVVQPIDDRRVVLDALHQALERLRGRGDRRLDRARQLGRRGRGGLRRASASSAQEAVARELLVDLLQRLLHPRARPRCRSGSWLRRAMLPMSPTWL